MNRVLRLFASWMLIFALCALVMLVVKPLAAQEVTPETAVTEPPVVVIVPPAPTEQETFNFWQWLSANSAVVISAIFGTALILQGIQYRRTLKDVLEHADKRSKDAVEAAHEALPEAAQNFIGRALTMAEHLADQFTAVLKFAREVTDGKPNTDPPATASSTSDFSGTVPPT